MGFKRLLAVALCLLLAGCAAPVTTVQTPFSTTAAANVTDAAQTPQPTATPQEATATPQATASPEATDAATATPEATEGETAAPDAGQAIEATVMTVGDIMFHGAQIDAAYDAKTKTYDFNNSYRFVKDILGSADAAMGNFECTLGGPNKPWSQPDSMSFNAPDSGADALAAAGFDLLSTAKNHTNDRGRDGVIRTVETLRDKGITVVGTRKSADEKPYAILDVKGIKIGVTGYTFGSRNGDILNVYSTNAAEQAPKFAKMAEDMRADGADLVMFYIHWGAEYQRAPNAGQKKLAQAMADAGVDIICGSHPHVLQTVGQLTGEKGNKTFVAWSMGNFISNQITRWNATKFKYTEDTMILRFTLRKQDGKAEVAAVEYLPVWNMCVGPNSNRSYTLLPIEKALQTPDAFDMPSAYERNKAALALKNTDELLSGAVQDGIITKLVLP
jgi:poly-gamma-glutamate synthesis protein (capsule biosynthesis protein)